MHVDQNCIYSIQERPFVEDNLFLKHYSLQFFSLLLAWLDEEFMEKQQHIRASPAAPALCRFS